MGIQSVLFKKRYWTENDAIQYLIDHRFRHDDIEETENYYRFRQTDPVTGSDYFIKNSKNYKSIKYVIEY